MHTSRAWRRPKANEFVVPSIAATARPTRRCSQTAFTIVGVRLQSVHVTEFKSIKDSGVLPLGSITLLVGPNNAGKSAVVQAVYSLQVGAALGGAVRAGASNSGVRVLVDEVGEKNPWGVTAPQSFEI